MEPQATENNRDQKKLALAAGIDSVSASTISMHRDLKKRKRVWDGPVAQGARILVASRYEVIQTPGPTPKRSIQDKEAQANFETNVRRFGKKPMAEEGD
jgi:hypothetical protein